MKSLTLLCLAIVSLACSESEHTRGARRVPGAFPPARFDRAQSTGLFVGVRTFDDPDVQEVAYAVDDAVDLAYTFALERNVALVMPQRVVLALSDEPTKPESRERLEKLRKSGARVTAAARENILALLDEQAKKTGPEGILIAAFATHGFTLEGSPYVLSRNSLFGDDATSLSAAKISDVAATATRSLIFIDACRERVGAGARGATRAPAPLLRRMSGVYGQVVFYAGQYAYDDHKKRNGVFTSAVLECLRCDARRDARGIVTAQTLVDSVEKRMLKWIQENRDPSVRSATQFIMDTDAQAMPIAVCTHTPDPERLVTAGLTVSAFDKNDAQLWERDVEGGIALSAVADLDGDEINEVIVATQNAITVFDDEGQPLWTAPTPAVDEMLTADLFRKKRRQVVVRAGSRLTIFDSDGTPIDTYTHPRELQHAIVGRETTRHAPKIIAADVAGNVFVLNPNKVTLVWQGVVRPNAPIRGLELTDHDGDRKNEISIRTAKGRVLLAFDGHTLESDGAQFFSRE